MGLAAFLHDRCSLNGYSCCRSETLKNRWLIKLPNLGLNLASKAATVKMNINAKKLFSSFGSDIAVMKNELKRGF